MPPRKPCIERKTEPSGWRLIETAPKDGREIILAWRAAVDEPGGKPAWFMTIGCWDDQFEYQGFDEAAGKCSYRAAWTDYTVASWGYEEYAEIHPTHWMTKPSAPQEGS